MASNATDAPPRRAQAAAPDTSALQEQSQHAAAFLRALANGNRLLLLCSLVSEELSVSDLGARTGIAQPSLSQQLSVLRAEGLVGTRREGKSVFYSIAEPSVLSMLQTLQHIFCPAPAQRRARSRRRA